MTFANPNIPEEIRRVASDGTALRYALMELGNRPEVIALGRGRPRPTHPTAYPASGAACPTGRSNRSDPNCRVARTARGNRP
ncbi:MAG UNVERIFIED_CONTAM: hypothetical protein LVT10_06570 [Anaerolineae bacterium]